METKVAGTYKAWKEQFYLKRDVVESIPTMQDLNHIISLAFRHVLKIEARFQDFQIIKEGMGLDISDRMVDPDCTSLPDSVKGLAEKLVPEMAIYMHRSLMKDPDAIDRDTLEKAIESIILAYFSLPPDVRSSDTNFKIVNTEIADIKVIEEECAALAKRMGMDVEAWKQAVGYLNPHEALAEGEGDSSEDMEEESPRGERRLPDRYEVRVNGVKVDGSSRIDHATRKWNWAVQGGSRDAVLVDLKTGQTIKGRRHNEPTRGQTTQEG